MTRGRIEAFSDGVLAIVITIMVLELHVPEGHSFADLIPLLPRFAGYAVSFLYVGIFWSNHHHLLQTVEKVNGGMLWANLHLLFWLSLVPFATEWAGDNVLEPAPLSLYGGMLLMAAIAWWLLERTIIGADRSSSLLARAVGRDLKGRLSVVAYALAIAAAWVAPALSAAIYVAVALSWLIPDRRIERTIAR